MRIMEAVLLVLIVAFVIGLVSGHIAIVKVVKFINDLLGRM